MLRSVALMLLASMLAIPAAAQEKFTIKIRKDAKGDVLKVTETDNETGKMKINVNGMDMPKDESKGHSAAYTEKIIEKESGKRATKLERAYTKAEMMRDGAKSTPSFVGKTVLIERGSSGYKFTVDGKDLGAEDARFFAEEFKHNKLEDETSLEQAILPKDPIAVNGTWKPDTKLLVKEFKKEGDAPLEFDEDKATATGKLLKAYKQGDKQYGDIEIVITLPLKSIGAGGMKIEMQPGSDVKLTFRFDGCIDGTASLGTMAMGMDLKMKGSLNVNGMEVKLDGNVKKNATKTQEAAK